MEARELRIGNLIHFPFIGKDVEVLGINAYQTNNGDILNKLSVREDKDLYCEGLNLFKPIPLTEDWLVKFGFEKVDQNGDYQLKINECSPDGDAYWIYIDSGNDNETKTQTVLLVSEEGDWLPTKNKYVHQVQNLFFDLTGNELTLKG